MRHPLALRTPLCLLAVAGASLLARPAGAAANFSASVNCFDRAPVPCVAFAHRDPPDPVFYATRFVNSGDETARNVHFRNNLNNLGSTCGGALDPDDLRPPTCTADPLTCGGFACQGLRLTGGILTADMEAMPPGCEVTVTIGMFVRQGSQGTCCDQAEITWDDSSGGGRAVTTEACFNAGLPNLEIVKTLDPPGQVPLPGEPVSFLITVTNVNPTATLDTATVRDVLDPNGCLRIADCSQVQCDPPSSCGACAMSLDPPGFTHEVRALGPRESVTLRVLATVDAAAVPGAPCFNRAETSDVDPLPEQSVVQVPVAAAQPPCPLLKADVSFSPVSPPRVGDWVYVRSCAAGGHNTLADVLQASGQPGDLGEAAAGAPGSLRLYQMDCGSSCAPRIGLRKAAPSGNVALEFF